MSRSAGLAIERVDVESIDVPLADDFVISRGRIARAEIAVVRLTLASGVEGYGEAAPFEALTGETRDGSAGALSRLGALVTGRSVTESRDLARDLAQAEPHETAARAALECAMVDALCRAGEVPLWRFWGATTARTLETDVTLPLLDDARVMELAEGWYARNFRTFKLKVGVDADAEASRVLALAARFPDVSFVLDANQGFDEASALAFATSLASLEKRFVLFEQPLDRADLEGMASLRSRINVPVAADESVFSREDAGAVIRAGAADVINLKITKAGLFETLAIRDTAAAHGLGVMVGGMVETRLMMGFSLCLAVAFGGVRYLDLDTPLLMTNDPFTGGYTYNGPRMTPSNEAGVGIARAR